MLSKREVPMPAETILGVSLILGVFAFFAAVLVYGDMTWDR